MASRKFDADIDLQTISRIINSAAPVNPGDVATKAYVDAYLEGIDWKESVRVRAQGNTNLASPGATVDGIAMSAGERFLADLQSVPEDCGIYVWNGAAVPATRAADASTAAELEGAVVQIKEGTNEGSWYRQTSVSFTLGTDPVVFEEFGSVVPTATEATAGILEVATTAETNAGSADDKIVTPLKLAGYTGFPRKYATDVGDNSNTLYTITHNLGTRDVLVQVFRNSGARDQVECQVTHDTTNTVVLEFATAPTTNLFRVAVIG